MPRPRRKSRKVGFAEAGASTGTDSDASQNASARYEGSTAEVEEYAAKFGHYKKEPQGRPVLTSEPSTRAGTQYLGDASVRAGSNLRAIAEDPSVRIRGSDMDKSVHMRALQTQDSDGLVPMRVVKLANK